MTAVFIEPSPKALDLYESAKLQWEQAMQIVPEAVRSNLDVHQIQALVGWDMDAKFKEARARLKTNDSISADIVMHRGKLAYRYAA